MLRCICTRCSRENTSQFRLADCERKGDHIWTPILNQSNGAFLVQDGSGDKKKAAKKAGTDESFPNPPKLKPLTQRQLQEQDFREAVISEYNLRNPQNSDEIMCQISGMYFTAENITVVHIIPVDRKSRMAVLGKAADDVWSTRNGLCLYSSIAKGFTRGEMVFLYDVVNQKFVLKVLYDEILEKQVGYSRKKLLGGDNVGSVLYKDISDRYLIFNDSKPFIGALNWAAKIAIEKSLLNQSRTHECITSLGLSAATWDSLFESSKDLMTDDEASIMPSDLIIENDSEEENAGDGEPSDNTGTGTRRRKFNLCFEFQKTGGCTRDNCRFLHE